MKPPFFKEIYKRNSHIYKILANPKRLGIQIILINSMKKNRLSLILFGATVLTVVGAYFFLRGGSDVVITDNAPWFSPAVLEIEPGTTVTWHLKSPAVHPVMAVEGPIEIHSGHFTDTWSYKFDTPGVYVYVCPIHPYMKGVIGVGEKVPEEKIPAWVKQWPPDYKAPPGSEPEVGGVGKIWVAAQFEERKDKDKPGVIYVINAKTWEIENVIADNRINNPHNLWEVNGKILVTNWFDKFLSVVDKMSGILEKQVWIGESPAHVHSHGNDKIYVTVQGDDGIAILDTEFEVQEKIRAPKGPHGHWMTPDGRFMALASTEIGKLSVWDLTTNMILFEEFVGNEDMNESEAVHKNVKEIHGAWILEEVYAHEGENELMDHPHSLPLMAGMTPDGQYAFIATSNGGKFYVFDVRARKMIKSFPVGAGPIQTVVSPDGKYVFIPLSGDGAVAVVQVSDWSLIKKIENVGAGAHGVYFGEKEGGGRYAYVSNKFATWVTVINVGTLSVAGYIPLPETAWGGQGILVTE